jgi:hypothetical protein
MESLKSLMPDIVIGITPKKSYLLNDMTGQRVDTSIIFKKRHTNK